MQVALLILPLSLDTSLSVLAQVSILTLLEPNWLSHPRVSERRLVRVGEVFFDALDEQLRPERGPNGEPSVGDFILVDLPPIAEVFATSFDLLPAPFAQRPDYRTYMMSGLLVPRALVTGHLGKDGAITLMDVALDLDASWD